jgi:hypothetical protein
MRAQDGWLVGQDEFAGWDFSPNPSRRDFAPSPETTLMDEATRQPVFEGDSSPAAQRDGCACHREGGAYDRPRSACDCAGGACACGTECSCHSQLTRLQFIRRTAVGAAGAAIGATALCGCNQQSKQATQAVDQDAADLAALRKVDPRLLIYHETGRFDTGFAEARGIAMHIDGSVCVAGDAEVRCFDNNGKRGLSFPTGGAPTCIARSGYNFVVGFSDHVEWYDEKGPRLATWPVIAGRPLVTSVAANAHEVWVGDSGNRLVIGFDYKGREIGRVGARDDGSHYPGLVLPSPHLDVALSKDGHVIVNNPGCHRIEVHNRAGKMLSYWGQESNEIEGFCGCCNPTDFAILPDGRFVTSEKGLPRVKIYSARGDFDGVVAGPDAFADSVVGLDLAAGDDGRVYVLDPKAKAVRIYAPRA